MKDRIQSCRDLFKHLVFKQILTAIRLHTLLRIISAFVTQWQVRGFQVNYRQHDFTQIKTLRQAVMSKVTSGWLRAVPVDHEAFRVPSPHHQSSAQQSRITSTLFSNQVHIPWIPVWLQGRNWRRGLANIEQIKLWVKSVGLRFWETWVMNSHTYLFSVKKWRNSHHTQFYKKIKGSKLSETTLNNFRVEKINATLI